MKYGLLVVFLLLADGLRAADCTPLQSVQLHQFRDLFLYLFQNTGYFPGFLGSCSRRFGNDVYGDSANAKGKGTSVIIGRNLALGEGSFPTTPKTLIVTIRDPALVDNPHGAGWGGFFSDVDADNLLRSLLNSEGRKRAITFMNYVRGIGADTVAHVISFFFEKETKLRYFIILTRSDSMSFVITDEIDWITKVGHLNYAQSAFSPNTLHSNRDGISFGFDKCLVSLRVYPDQPLTNLASCATSLFDLKGSLWKVQGKSLDNDDEFLRMFTYFVNEFERQRTTFSLDLFNLLVLSRLPWMTPVLFNKQQIHKRLALESCHLFNPKFYEGVRQLTAAEANLLAKMHAVFEQKCARIKRK